MTHTCIRYAVYRSLCARVRKMSTEAIFDSNHLFAYEAPSWALGLKGIPSHRLKLANLPTPIHKWDLPGTPGGFQVYIKRDDMTGSTLSGNKVRKLEFLLADALQNGCRHVITCGGIQSNHCRATAIAARQLGLQPHLVLRAGIETADEAGCVGNMFLNRLAGARIYAAPKASQHSRDLLPRMEKIAEKIRSETGEKTYVVPVGGSNTVGLWGYMNAFNELLEQNAVDHFDDIVFACGSGGTAEGLAIANYLTGSNFRIHGVAVSDGKTYFYNHVDETLETMGLGGEVAAQDILDVVEGYKGKGYGISTQEDLDYGIEVATETGIMLDPTYTLKGVRGLASEMQNNPTRFKGKRILFIHTGGIFGMYDGRLNDTLLKEGAATNSVQIWNNLENPPF